MPLRLCVAASDEWASPDSGRELAALSDHFLLRKEVTPVRTRAGRQPAARSRPCSTSTATPTGAACRIGRCVERDTADSLPPELVGLHLGTGRDHAGDPRVRVWAILKDDLQGTPRFAEVTRAAREAVTRAAFDTSCVFYPYVDIAEAFVTLLVRRHDADSDRGATFQQVHADGVAPLARSAFAALPPRDRRAVALHPRRRPQRLGLVGLLPGEVRRLAPEVPVAGALAVDRPPQV